MLFKDISTVSSGSQFGLTAEWTDLCIFGKVYYETSFFELGPVVQPEMSGCHFVKLSKIVSERLLEGIMRNISVKKLF